MAKHNYNRIKAVLAEKNFTSKELAQRLNKSETTVSRWCTNDIQPSIETLIPDSQNAECGYKRFIGSYKITLSYILYK
jgi:transcriptional regulator with XRE-family HTH domain